jgi:hypothetical protein
MVWMTAFIRMRENDWMVVAVEKPGQMVRMLGDVPRCLLVRTLEDEVAADIPAKARALCNSRRRRWAYSCHVAHPALRASSPERGAPSVMCTIAQGNQHSHSDHFVVRMGGDDQNPHDNRRATLLPVAGRSA